MRHATHSSGTQVVVKLLRPGSDELEILQYLQSFTSSDKYILPLIGTLTLDVGTFFLLPEAIPLNQGFAIQTFRDKDVDFGSQLTNGVAYLHRCNVAHLDIKPQNIVALKNRLFIIDFDISIRVSGPDMTIDRWCGTPGWMAPEIGHQNGPRRPYSPIRADLWSCGLMLRYLASNGVVTSKTLTEQLLRKDPCLRPLLAPQSSVTVAHPLSDRNGGLKRKLELDTLCDAKRRPHDAKQLAFV
jgi:serine/threonine protein kinase